MPSDKPADAAPRHRPATPWVAYACAVCVLAALATGAVLALHPPSARLDLRFWLLGALAIIGELFPVRVPRAGTSDEVTISTPFAFAILLSYGVIPAAVAYVVAYLVAAAVERVSPMKVAFNAAQYALSLFAAAGVLALVHHLRWDANAVGGSLGAVFLGGAAVFAVNHVLAGVSGALLGRERVGHYLRRDLLFQAWTSGSLLTLSPVVLAAAEANLSLVPLLFVPMLAIWAGGREAARGEVRALHDALTGLPNRRHFLQNVEAALQARRELGGSVAVIIMDLDDFKAVNDTLGHEQGDRLLVTIAERLSVYGREGATVARLGGDEFAVLTGEIAESDQAVVVAEGMIQTLQHPYELAGVSFDVRASVGIAAYPGHGDNAAALLQHADVALYRAKQSHSPYEVYVAEHDEHSRERLALAGQLRRGIEEGELIVHYQPKVALRADRPDAMEALVRWRHPELGEIAPNGFIPLAERTGLIKPLTLYVLSSALEQCMRWRNEGSEVRLSVNVSNRSLMDRELVYRIRELLGRHGIPAEVLQLEITEGELVSDLPRARAALDELRGMGVTIAIDDFGTGFSSLAQLQKLPVDEIKIDKSFVLDMESNASDAAIVRSTIELGRSMNLTVTAEGIESEEVVRRLTDLGCDYGQGFFLGRPAEPESGTGPAVAGARARGRITGAARGGDCPSPVSAITGGRVA